MTSRFFTVDQVNALLPSLRAAVERITVVIERLHDLSARLFGDGRPSPDTAVDPDYVAAVLAVQAGVESIQQMGGEVKDLRQGLVDFRSMRNGNEVYLCWVRGEDKVAFWHELQAGFAGRTAITDHSEFKGDPTA